MTDRKPPRVFGDARATLLALLDYQRESVVRKVEGVSDDDARRSPVSSGTSLLWLVEHLAWAEALWVLERFAGEKHVDHDVAPDGTLSAAVAHYRTTWARVDAVIAASDLDTVCAGIEGQDNPTLLWVIAHLVEETARHAGHADILRELIDGQTGR